MRRPLSHRNIHSQDEKCPKLYWFVIGTTTQKHTKHNVLHNVLLAHGNLLLTATSSVRSSPRQRHRQLRSSCMSSPLATWNAKKLRSIGTQHIAIKSKLTNTGPDARQTTPSHFSSSCYTYPPLHERLHRLPHRTLQDPTST